MGSLSRAARALRVSPAAVSRTLSALERELGTSLLVRTTRTLAMTDEGSRFYAGAQRALREVDEARGSVSARSGVAGLLTVSAPTALGLGRLDASLPVLIARHPGLRIDLRLEDHVIDLVADGVDIAIRAGIAPPDNTYVVAHRIGVGARVVVASPSYLKRRGEPVQPSQLARHATVSHLTGSGAVGTWDLVRGDEVVSVEVSGVTYGTGNGAQNERVFNGQ
jgi:DNA-binding transcriptional LysR family regulator